MFSSVTATGTVAAAQQWAGLIEGPVLIVCGLGLLFLVAGWVVSKLVHR